MNIKAIINYVELGGLIAFWSKFTGGMCQAIPQAEDGSAKSEYDEDKYNEI